MPCNQSNTSVGNSNVHSVGEELTALHRPNVLYMVSMSPDIGSTSTSYTQCRPTEAKVGVACAAGSQASSHHQYRPNIIQIVPSVLGSGASSNDLFDCKCGPLVLNDCTRRTAPLLLSVVTLLQQCTCFIFLFLPAFFCTFYFHFILPLSHVSSSFFAPTPIYFCFILPPTGIRAVRKTVLF